MKGEGSGSPTICSATRRPTSGSTARPRCLLEGLPGGRAGLEWRHLWVLIVFSLWHQIFVEQVYDPVRWAGNGAPG